MRFARENKMQNQMQKSYKYQSIRYRLVAAIEAYNNLLLDSIDTIDLDVADDLNNQISTEASFIFKKINPDDNLLSESAVIQKGKSLRYWMKRHRYCCIDEAQYIDTLNFVEESVVEPPKIHSMPTTDWLDIGTIISNVSIFIYLIYI